MQVAPGDVIHGRYVVYECLGEGTFATAVSARDRTTGRDVCLKIVRPWKEFFDQGLDEVKLLRHVNAADKDDGAGILRLRSCLYYREHLVLVTELLGSDLDAWQEHVQDQQLQPYFTMARIQRIAGQVRCSCMTRILTPASRDCCSSGRARAERLGRILCTLRVALAVLPRLCNKGRAVCSCSGRWRSCTRRASGTAT